MFLGFFLFSFSPNYSIVFQSKRAWCCKWMYMVSWTLVKTPLSLQSVQKSSNRNEWEWIIESGAEKWGCLIFQNYTVRRYLLCRKRKQARKDIGQRVTINLVSVIPDIFNVNNPLPPSSSILRHTYCYYILLLCIRYQWMCMVQACRKLHLWGISGMR